MSDELVGLTVATNEIQAGLLANMLELEGIESLTRAADGLNNMNGGLSDRKEILVKREDLEAARAILESAEL